jgi:hypothetical protein
MRTQGYDPNIAAIDDGMSDPPSPEDLAKAVRFNMADLDAVHPTGIELDGALYVVQGVEKNRKTTLVQNWARNICNGPEFDGYVIVDVVESRSSPKTYKQQLICMEATALMAHRVFGGLTRIPMLSDGVDRDTGRSLHYVDARKMSGKLDPKADDDNALLFRLSRKRVLSGLLTPTQLWAIEKARENVSKWPMYIFGAPSRQGSTKSLELPGNGVEIEECRPYKRWKKWVEALRGDEEDESKWKKIVLIIDHAHTYNIPAGFDALEKVAMHIGAGIAQLKICIIAVAQTSLGTDRMYAKGGSKLSEEANMVMMPKYDRSDEGKYNLRVNCLASEDEPPADFNVPIEPFSGLILPYTRPA